MPIDPPEHPVIALRRSLLLLGWQPVAVYTGQKRPYGDAWQKHRGMPPFSTAALSTGILCEGCRGVDIDIDDPQEAAEAVRIVEAEFGATPLHRVRAGSPRRTLVYRGAGRKWIMKLKSGKIEILGEGNQFVAFGKHPDGSEYLWIDASPADYPARGF